MAAVRSTCFDVVSSCNQLPKSGRSAFGQSGEGARTTLPPAAGPATPLKRAPAWLKRPAGVAFGFGNRLVSFKNVSRPGHAGEHADTGIVSLSHVSSSYTYASSSHWLHCLPECQHHLMALMLCIAWYPSRVYPAQGMLESMFTQALSPCLIELNPRVMMHCVPSTGNALTNRPAASGHYLTRLQSCLKSFDLSYNTTNAQTVAAQVASVSMA